MSILFTRLFEYFVDILLCVFLIGNSIDSLDLDDQHIRNVLNWSVNTERLQSLQQLVEGELSFLWILPKIQPENIQSEWVRIKGRFIVTLTFHLQSFFLCILFPG